MCLEFSLVLKGEQLEDVFQRQWELWCPAVIEYALQVQNKLAQLKNALRDLESGYEGEHENMTASCESYFVFSPLHSVWSMLSLICCVCVCIALTCSSPTHYFPTIH